MFDRNTLFHRQKRGRELLIKKQTEACREERMNCKFCGKEINSQKFTTDNESYVCNECEAYCMSKCKEALKVTTNWHTEPCVSCKHNPYVVSHLWKWNGMEWVKNVTD